ncbi:sugar kinase [Holotrichia oblita]|nr:sugar kinase [Holotrichia oblita]
MTELIFCYTILNIFSCHSEHAPAHLPRRISTYKTNSSSHSDNCPSALPFAQAEVNATHTPSAWRTQMAREFIMAVDQGTTSSRAVIFNKKGEIVSYSAKEFPQIYPRAGWVEHNPKDITDSVEFVMLDAVKKAGVNADNIDSIGITNQRETTLVWDRNTGVPIYNAIVWQCRRTADFCTQLKESEKERMIYAKTGLTADAYFSATKLKWILDTVKGARTKAYNGDLCFGTVDTYLMWHLSKGKIFKTDYSNASRTMLYNIHDFCYDKELLKLFEIPECMLPKVCASSHFYGKTDASFFGCEIPVMGVAGDQQAALFGHLCLEKGDIKNTYGTGCFLLMNTGGECVDSKRGLISTLGASVNPDGRPDYCLEGSVFIGGAVVKWLRDEMGLIENAAQSETIAKSIKDTNGVYFVPAFVGLGAPHWDADVRGMICGLTRGTGKAHIVRAALEAIAYQVFDVVHAMERDTGVTINKLTVGGGASMNNFLLKFQSDILNIPVERPKMAETTALGACFLAGLKSGYFKDTAELKKLAVSENQFSPDMDSATRDKLIMGWETAIARARAR